MLKREKCQSEIGSLGSITGYKIIHLFLMFFALPGPAWETFADFSPVEPTVILNIRNRLKLILPCILKKTQNKKIIIKSVPHLAQQVFLFLLLSDSLETSIFSIVRL